jgi:hypothetical protein
MMTDQGTVPLLLSKRAKIFPEALLNSDPRCCQGWAELQVKPTRTAIGVSHSSIVRPRAQGWSPPQTSQQPRQGFQTRSFNDPKPRHLVTHYCILFIQGNMQGLRM